MERLDTVEKKTVVEEVTDMVAFQVISYKYFCFHSEVEDSWHAKSLRLRKQKSWGWRCEDNEEDWRTANKNWLFETQEIVII